MQNYTVLTHGRTRLILSPFRFTKKRATTLAMQMNDLTNSKKHIPIKLDPEQLHLHTPCDPKWKLFDLLNILGMVEPTSGPYNYLNSPGKC